MAEKGLGRCAGLPRQRIELLRWTQFTYCAHLALADHVHEFDAGNGCCRRSKRFEAEHRPHHSLDDAVVLFDDVIQIFDLTDFDVRLMLRVVTFERRRVGAAGLSGILVCGAIVDRWRRTMAIKKDTLDELLAGRDPKEVFSKDGLFDELKKALAERVLNAEMDDHLEGEAAAGKRNHRNGYSKKTVLTETSKIDMQVPRDREGSFDPKLIARYQRRFPGLRREDHLDVCARHDGPRDPGPSGGTLRA